MKKNAEKKKKDTKIWLWIVSIVTLVLAISKFPAFASLLFFAVGLATLPVKKWQIFIESKLPEKVKKAKTLIVVAAATLGFICSPGQSSEIQNDNVISETINIQEIEESLETNKEESLESIIEETQIIASSEEVALIESTTEKSTEDSKVQSTESQEADIASDIESKPEITEDSYFEVHYLDVGQGDAALVCCDGQYLLIDGGNKTDSSLIYSYLEDLNATYLDYIVASHAHEDHIGGLSGALNYASVGTVYCPVTEYDTEAFKDFKKYVEKAGVTITVPEAGDSFYIGSAKAKIIGLNVGSNENDKSIVLRICYGETSFLFTGDAEREAEEAILCNGYDLGSTVLKVGHHGSDDSTTYPFLREIMPSVAIISVGAGNGYDQPMEGTLSKLKDADVKVYRTDLQGDIIVKSNGKDVTVEVEKNPDADTLAPQAASASIPTSNSTSESVMPEESESNEPESNETNTTGAYAVNGNNGKIHMVGSCAATGSGKNAMKNPVYFDTFEQAEQYSISIAPSEKKRKCGNCWK